MIQETHTVSHHEKENVRPNSLHSRNLSLDPRNQAEGRWAADFAFAFDIDGVLLRGTVPIPGAKETLEKLQAESIPFILLTNGGGLTEAAHAERTSQRLGLCIQEDQFIQSHTPFRQFVDKYKEKWVLVLGGHGNKVKELAVAYGLDRVLTTSDLAKHHPTINPFPEITNSHHNEFGRIETRFTADDQIAAVFVFSSPRDWCLDLQISVDLLLSEGGRLGTRSAKNGDDQLPHAGYQQDGQPTFYFCNPDAEWATSHNQPRVAQGSFRAALEGVWAGITKGRAPLRFWTCGKPTKMTYTFAETAIAKCHAQLHPDAASPVRTVYMIGDNPESDIQGALMADKCSSLQWRSVLVETGVHKAGAVPRHQPSVIKEDVWEAVLWALREEMGVEIDQA